MEVATEEFNCQTMPPRGWHDIFPEEQYSEEDRRSQLIRDLVEHLLKPETNWISQIRYHHTHFVLKINVEQLLECQSPDLQPALELQPLECLSCITISCLESIAHRRDVPEHVIQECGSKNLRIRLVNHQFSQISVRELKANCIGRLVTVQGTVVRMGGVRPFITGMNFICTTCGSESGAVFSGGRYNPPSKCRAHGCRGTGFAPVKGSITSIDWQKIRLQEIASNESGPTGRVPRTVDVELFEDLVDTCSAGDTIAIVGLVKVINADQHQGWSKPKRNKGLFLIYIEANSVVNCSKGSEREAVDDGQVPCSKELAVGNPCFSMKDLQFVFRFTQEYDGFQFQELVHALCPSIHGHEMVKAAIVLALMGGVRKHADDSQHVPIRGDIHLLICGDPGTGKSQLLQAAASVAPKGLYVCGNGSTTAGLTVSVVQDALSGDFTFEAGALVLASGGICCVDELDKLKTDHKALLGAMEQQEVTLSKAGLCATMPAETGVIGAANPVDGHYHRGKTVMENLKMSDAMLSRFDLIFLLLDRPDEVQDQLLSDHILSMHSGDGERHGPARKKLLQQYPELSMGAFSDQKSETLQSRLKRYTAQDTEPMWPSLMRVYIDYARRFCMPRLTNEAKQILKDFYCELRNKAQSQNGLPITIRQLESLVRLAEARARCDLSQTVEVQHASEVVELMKFCTWDEWAPLCGEVNGSHRRGGKKAEMVRFIKALEQHVANQDKTLLSASDMFAVADEIDLQVENIRILIDEMNEAGILEKKGNGTFKLTPL
eukprot:jgi/Botrbrau1/21449/Bobra.0216s0057.1